MVPLESPTHHREKSHNALEALRDELSLDSLKLMVDRWTCEIEAATSENFEEIDKRLRREAHDVAKKENLAKRDTDRLNFILASLLLKQSRSIKNHPHS